MIGSGILGLLTSRELLKAGVKVTIIDANAIGRKRASSGYRLSGVFWQNNTLREIMREGLYWWSQWLEEKRYVPYLKRDMLEVFKDEASRSAIVELLGTYGVPFEKESRYEPLMIDAPSIVYPSAALLINIEKARESLMEELYAYGVTFLDEVVIDIDNQGKLQTNMSSHTFDSIILSVGAWANKYTSRFFDFQTVATRQNWYCVEQIPQENLPYVKDMRNARRIIPDGTSIRVFDGTVGGVIDPGTEQYDETEERTLQDYLSEYFGKKEFKLTRYGCQYEKSPDMTAVLDKNEKLFILMASTGAGVKSGPSLAKACATLVCKNEFMYPQFRAERFQ